MAEFQNDLVFNIDLASLERALDKMEKTIETTFTGNNLAQFDNKILDLNKRVQNLAGNLERAGISAGKSFAGIKGNIEEAVASLNDGNAALSKFSNLAIKARNDLNSALGAPGFKQAVEGLTYSGAGLSRLGPLDPRFGANGKFYSGSDRGSTSVLSRQTQGLDKDYQNAMKSMNQFYTQQAAQAEKANAGTKSWSESIATSALKWTLVGSAIGLVYKSWEQLHQSIIEGVDTIGEFQQQMVQLNSQMTVLTGKNAGVETGEILTSAMSLAAAYGDNINDVAQNIALWRKQTTDLSSAVALTNESLKFQVATGTDLEDTYRTLTALSTQLGGTMVADWDKTKYSLSDAHKLLSLVYASAITSGAGMRQIGSAGTESLNNLSNAAGILMHAMEQDADAMRTLGLNVSQIIALNQALITAMGNTGEGADNAAERMARLVAGFAALSNSSKAKTLSSQLGSEYQNLEKIVNSTTDQENKVVAIIKWYEQLNTQQRNFFTTQVASQRNYQQINNMAQALNQYEKNLTAEKKNSGALDDAAEKMNDTFLQQVQQLKGMWQGVVSVVGQELIPVLENVVTLTMQMAGGLGVILSYGHAGSSHDKDFINQAKYLGIKPEQGFNLTGSQIFNFNNRHLLSDPFTYYKQLHAQNAEEGYFRSVQKQLLDEAAKSNTADFDRIHNIIMGSKDFYSMFRSLGYARGHDKTSPLLQEFAPEWMTVGGAAEIGNLSYWSNPQNINALMKANMNISAIKDALSHDNSGLHLASPGAGKGTQTPGQMFGQAISDLTNQYHAYVSSVQDAIIIDDAYLSIQKKKMEMFGPTQSGLQNVINLYGQEGNTLRGSISELTKYQTAFSNQLTVAQAHMNGLAKNSDTYKQWAEAADRARTSLSEVHKELITNGTKAMETYMNALDAVNTVAKQYYDQITKIDEQGASTATKNLQSGTGSFEDVVNAWKKYADDGKEAIGNMVQGSLTWQEAMQQMHDKGTQAIDDLKTKWDNYVKGIESSITELQSHGLEDAFSVLSKTAVGPEKNDLEYYKQVIKSQQEINKAQIQYQQYMKEAGNDPYLKGLAQNYIDAATATVALDDATAQYLRDTQNIMDSGFFQALSKAIDQLGSGIASGITDQAFGDNRMRDQIFAYDEVISKLQEEKQYSDMAYSSAKNHSLQQEANHKLELFMLDQEIKKQQDLKKAEEDRLNHPGIFKKFATTFTKDIIDGMVKQLEQNVQNSILKAFMPKQDQALITAMQSHVLGMKASFQVPAEQLNKMMTTVFQPDIQQYFKTSVDEFNKRIDGPLKDKFDQFHVDIKDPFSQGMEKFHNSVADFVKALQNSKLWTGAGSSFDTTGHGTGTVNFVQGYSVMSQADFFNTALQYGDANNPIIDAYINSQSQSSQSSQALGTNSYSNSDTAMAIAGLAMGAGLPSGAGNFLSGIGGGGGIGGGFMNLLLGAGGGGAWTGVGAAGLGLVSAYSASQNKGNFLLGSLGGVLTAGAVMSLMTGATLFGSLGMAALGGPVGIGILLGSALLGGSVGGLFGPHYSQTTNPDMSPYASSDGYGQGMANAMGNSGYIQGLGGSVNEDPNLKQALGGMNELQYLDAFVKAHPNGQGLSGSALALWQQVNAFTQGGSAQGVGGLHQGNVGLTATAGGNSGPYWNTENWADLLKQIDSMTQSVQQFSSALQQGSTELIVGFNQFGSGVGFFPYVWSIPGYEYPANPAIPTSGGGSSPTQPTPRGSRGGGGAGAGNGPGGLSGGGQLRANAVYTYRPDGGSTSSNSFTVQTSVNLDGKTVARSVQSYQLQTARRGYDNIT